MKTSMNGLARALLCAVTLATATTATTAHAQETGTVPSGSLVYADIERLADLGILDSVILGQRPWSRREIARVARVARARMDGGRAGDNHRFSDDVNGYADVILRRLERYGSESTDEAVVRLLDGASLAFTSTDAKRRGFPALGTKPTEATIDPLAERRLGKFAVTGQTAALELGQRVEPTHWLALQARERLEGHHVTGDSTSDGDGEVLLATARIRLSNLALTVGRQQLTWAQREGDGLFLASDAPALDQVSISGDHPFVLPWLLRWLGPTQGTLVFADLGPSVSRSHSKLLAYKVSLQPHSTLELGGTFMNHFGGTGARKASFSDQVIDFLPFIDVFRKHNYTDTTRTFDVDSDKLLGVDGRWRTHLLGGVSFTGEMLIDDFDVGRIPKLLTGYGSQTFAAVFPRLGAPELSLRLSAKHMGIITYTHQALLDGITTRGRLLGDELGPDAKAFGAQLRYEMSGGTHLELEGRSATYSNANYRAFYSNTAETDYVVQKVSKTADELRDMLLGSAVMQTEDGFAMTLRLGVEHIRNSAFAGGRRWDYAAQVAFRLEP